jgi:hypothetical protein
MTRVHLTTTRPEQPIGLDTLLWTRPTSESSFHTSLVPSAAPLGPMSDQALGLLRTAVAVYLADRTTPRDAREGNRWRRQIDLIVDVPDPDAMDTVADQLTDVLEFLTDDDWSLTYKADRTPPRTNSVPELPVVSLFSGGIDSLCGVLLAARTGPPPHLVAHWDNGVASDTQKTVGAMAKRMLGVPLTWNRIRLSRAARQRGSNLSFGKEPTSRSRSLLFLALGVAAAEPRHAELWIPENGYVSLNIPLAPERRGAHSTRTTHPRVLDGIRDVLAELGIDVALVTPFAAQTKGEVMIDAAKHHDIGDLERLFAETHSCAKSNVQWERVPPRTHCGVCFACLVRRGGFIKAGITDNTPYIEVMKRNTPMQRTAWLGSGRRLDVDAVRYGAMRGFDAGDVLATGLPATTNIADAVDLARRGLAELAAVQIP